MKLFSRKKEQPPIYHVTAIIAAAGSSSRMGGADKLFSGIGGCPVLALALLAFENSEYVGDIIVATAEHNIVPVSDIAKAYGITKLVHIVKGGETRQQSVASALAFLSGQTTHIAIHDAARPLVTSKIISDAVETALEYHAAAPLVSVKDTIKEAHDGAITRTVPRGNLYAVQTPQVFERALYERALRGAQRNQLTVTDDCEIVEILGAKVYMVDGSYENIKITTPEDVAIAEAILAARG